MSVRDGIGVVDTVLLFPQPASTPKYGFVQASLGQNSGDPSASPVKYMFRDSPVLPEGEETISYTVGLMDRWGISHALVDLGFDPCAGEALRRYPDRFVGVASCDPHTGMDGIRALERTASEFNICGVTLGAGPAFLNPPVAINDARMYPIYAKCVELDLAVFITVGVPGPRVPMAPQRVDLLDEVCWFFPELRIVMRHGGEPWEDLAVKLMLKYPNLYYSTSGFAPRHYPRAIVDYANTRGADKIIYAGYYAIGLTWDRIFTELEDLELKDHVWPKFLRENAVRALKLQV
jgi:predicted TIM-barrel fold metal-dependent hydrolase